MFPKDTGPTFPTLSNLIPLCSLCISSLGFLPELPAEPDGLGCGGKGITRYQRYLGVSQALPLADPSLGCRPKASLGVVLRTESCDGAAFSMRHSFIVMPDLAQSRIWFANIVVSLMLKHTPAQPFDFFDIRMHLTITSGFFLSWWHKVVMCLITDETASLLS